MRHKYKKFLKAAYINYDEDYCSNAVLRSSRPPLSEILAPATFEITLSPGEGYYWTTFYTSMANYRAPEGVTVYKEHLEGRSITSSTVDDRIINKGQGVVIRSSTNTITLTKTYSISSDDYSDNSLIGTDYLITNPGHAYALGYKDSAGVAFYRLSSTGKIRANKAYLIIEDIYLTQWRLVGNSTVHTDEYLTQWKVSGNSQIQQYLTQWKVEGNSVVDNNSILSCGDLGQDGNYHVKISNGVTIYDIPLTEPLRKVNDIADNIEFVNGVATVTRNLASAILSDMRWYKVNISSTDKYRYYSADLRDNMKVFLNNQFAVMLCPIYDVHLASPVYNGTEIGIASNSNGIYLYDDNYDSVDDLTAFLAHINGIELIYELATPTTEVIQVSPFPISSTDTYTSANDTPYSAFEYKKNVEIWSCGEYSAVDGKYHILVQPLGGSIADIALDEPLRKVNDVADSIEFPSDTEGKALVTRNNAFIRQSFSSGYNGYFDSTGTIFYTTIISDIANMTINERFAIIICNKCETSFFAGMQNVDIVAIGTFRHTVIFRNYEIEQTEAAYKTWLATLGELDIIYQLETPTTETIQVPQIEEADSYSCVISQGGKAVSWSSFETE